MRLRKNLINDLLRLYSDKSKGSKESGEDINLVFVRKSSSQRRIKDPVKYQRWNVSRK